MLHRDDAEFVVASAVVALLVLATGAAAGFVFAVRFLL
jgi:hypothetical protein